MGSRPALRATTRRLAFHAACVACTLGLVGLLAAPGARAGAAEPGPKGDDAASTLSRTLHFDTIHFSLRWPAAGAGMLEIVPAGLQNDNQPIQRPIDGTLRDATIADIDADGSPELYVVVDGPHGKQQLLVWVANRRRSLSEAVVIGGDGEPGGGGRWRIGDGGLHRHDAKGEVRYRLRPGEAAWRIEPANDSRHPH